MTDHALDHPWAHPRAQRATCRDAAAVHAMVLRCSAESLYGRFLTVVQPEIAASKIVANLSSESAIWWLAAVDDAVVGIGATHLFDDGAAEISLLVEDDWQGRGVATRLLPHLVDEARVRHAPHIWATALRARMPIIRKLARGVSGSVTVSVSGGIAEMTAELPEDARRKFHQLDLMDQVTPGYVGPRAVAYAFARRSP
jgi:GNAT superfamily N-acetyltransferase